MNDDHNLAEKLRCLAERAVMDLRAEGGVAGKKAADEVLKTCEERARDGHCKYSGIVFSGMKARAWVDAFLAAFKGGFEGSGLRVVAYDSARGTEEFLADKTMPPDVRAVAINAEVSW